ncbi:MAG: UDP-N-acetylmuramoyl-tripeptide--D-alanyl-D-alanine ligase, partial [Luteitalea sp.]
GAGAVVVREAQSVDAGQVPTIVVDDPLRGLQDAAHVIRRRAGTTVVGITGSAGKTTTKEITATLLARRFTTFRNRGNLNNHIGLPLSLFELRTSPRMAVVEFGMSGAGEIRRLVQIAEPQLRVWTNVGDAHLGFFASVDAIADAKQEILEGAQAGDVLVANAGDPMVSARASRFAGRVVTFAVDAPADVSITGIRARGLDGTTATMTLAGVSRTIETRLIGTGNLANIAAAAAVAVECGIAPDEVVAEVSDLVPAAHRGEVVRTAGGWTVVDDAYNSTPSALLLALQTLATAPGRRVAVLGEMLELGEFAASRHADCGHEAARLCIEVVIAVGGEPTRALADAARTSSPADTVVEYVGDSAEAAALVRMLVRAGDSILVKGSRGVRMERVVQSLIGEVR